MAWEFVDAKLVNDRVAKVKLRNADGDPTTEDDKRLLVYTRDNTQNQAQFRAMVRREVIATLAHLNSVDNEVDISDQVRP